LSALQTNLSHTLHLSAVGDYNDEQDILPQMPKGWSIIANFTPQIIKCQIHFLGLIQVSQVSRPAVLKEQFTQKWKLCDYLL